MSILGLHQRVSSNPPSTGYADADDKLALEYQPVLPLLSKSSFLEALRRVPLREIRQVLQHRVLPVANIPGLVLYASCGKQALDHAVRHQLKLVAKLSPAEFHNAVRQTWGARLLHTATFRHDSCNPQFSARCRATTGQILAFACCVAGALCSLAFLPINVVWTFASTLVALFFLSVIALRLFCVLPGVQPSRRPAARLRDADLPVYSVLVPIFREVAVLDQLLAGLMHLNYPALCIKRTKIIPGI